MNIILTIIIKKN